jgi:hypothetical protein
MKKQFAILLAVAGLAMAAMKSYPVTLYSPAKVNGKELKAGDYKLEIDGDKAVLRSGKTQVESPVKVETGDTKFRSTSVRLGGEDQKQLEEIRLGGTRTKLVFGAKG